MTSTPRDWKPKLQSLVNNYPEGVIYSEIEEYVSALLEEARQEEREKCIACVPDDMFVGSEYERGKNDGRNEIRNSIQSL